ncbi:MAG TPA: class I SAM-dependent methyltransferase [Rhizomicrobium sp.]|nr:class I SAM-dependent methyltransferase [Rhizomicrobium sp.]
MTPAADPHYFTEQALRDWTKIGARHRIRDEYFLRSIEPFFTPGSILEIGAATGHISEILRERGHDITASDVSPRFVAAMRARGLRAEIVDVTGNIRSQTGQSFANIFAQNVIPMIRREHATLTAVLSALHDALTPAGRLICVGAHPWRCEKPGEFFRPREQMEIASASGFFRPIRIFPHQVVPTSLYRRWNGALLNLLDFQAARIAAVRLVWVMEKIG